MILYILVITALIGFVRKVDLFAAFSDGARDGLQSALRIAPCLAATLTALGVMKSSGALEGLCKALLPVTSWAGLPSETLPIFVLRPFSGSASLGLLRDVFTAYGPDSRIGLIASTMMGSGETVFYTCALYLGAAGVRKSAYIIPVSLIGWVCGCLISVSFFT